MVVTGQSCGQNMGVIALTLDVRMPCVSCSLAAVLHPYKIARDYRKENEHVENLVFVIAAAMSPCDIARHPVLWCCGQHRRTAAYNTIIFLRRQVYHCCMIDVKQAYLGSINCFVQIGQSDQNICYHAIELHFTSYMSLLLNRLY